MESRSEKGAGRPHWLLPVDPAAHAEHLPSDWRTRPDAGVVWKSIGRTQPLDRWCLRTGYRTMRSGDVIWAYLSRRGELCAVGTVREIVQEEDDSHHVLVDWDPERTTELGREPLPRKEFGQVPMSVARANETAARVLEKRLGEFPSPAADGSPPRPTESHPPQTTEESPPRTDDGHHIVVDGRRWRATDPGIPEKLRAELVAELMRARRLVRSGGQDARPMVNDAKVALGERGDPWWEPTDDGRRARLAATVRTLLRHRDGATACPSDAARVVGGEDWRPLIPLAREVAGELAAQGTIRVTRSGEDVDPANPGGPIRLAPGPNLTR